MSGFGNTSANLVSYCLSQDAHGLTGATVTAEALVQRLGL